jgi:hypothetical protein
MAAAILFAIAAPSAHAQAPPEGRVYEQVTPVEKGSSIIENRYMNALPGGTGVRYTVRGVPAEAKGNPTQPRFVSLRGADGWSSWIAVDPPLRAPPWLIIFQTTLAVSDDGHQALVVSNRALAPGGVDAADAANLYVSDLRTGSYHWVGTAIGRDALSSFVGSFAMDKYVAGAPDFSWVLFFSEYPLLPSVTSGALYRWSAAAGLEVVSVLPGGYDPAVPVQRLDWRNLPRQASADGHRIFFGLEGGAVYLRENGTTTPVSISKLDGTVQPAEFVDTDVTGRFVFYVSSQQLLPGVPPADGALYRYDLQTGDLVFVGVLYSGASERGVHLFAVSADGQSVYYASPRDGELVSWRDGYEGPVSEAIPGTNRDASNQYLSPDGRYLAFGKSLDPDRTSSDVYLYDAATGLLSCASCLGGETTGKAELPFPERAFENTNGRAVDDQGRVFFSSPAPLVPEDDNGVADVYVFAHGSASLISPGTQTPRALYGGISEDRSDVFFVTAASLVAQDRDDQADLYDARIGGGFPSQAEGEPLGCSGESCQPPAPTPPPDPTIGSGAAGPQRLPAAKRHRCRKSKRRCVASRSKRAVGRGHGRHGGKRRDRPAS